MENKHLNDLYNQSLKDYEEILNKYELLQSYCNDLRTGIRKLMNANNEYFHKLCAIKKIVDNTEVYVYKDKRNNNYYEIHEDIFKKINIIIGDSNEEQNNNNSY